MRSKHGQKRTSQDDAPQVKHSGKQILSGAESKTITADSPPTSLTTVIFCVLGEYLGLSELKQTNYWKAQHTREI